MYIYIYIMTEVHTDHVCSLVRQESLLLVTSVPLTYPFAIRRVWPTSGYVIYFSNK